MAYSKKTIKDVRELTEKYGASSAARMLGKSLETVKRINRKYGEVDVIIDKNAHLPKVLVFDIETSPILARVWSLWKQNVGLNMIEEDWFILSYAAKWLGEDEVMYEDLRGVIDDTSKGFRDEGLLQGIWELLDQADVVITQNGINFDSKKLNARFVINGYQPPSGYKHIDTLRIAKRAFAFTSNKLEYMTDKLCKKYKKIKHANFSGFELWKECLADNIEAWKEMEQYNRYDVLSLEELYTIIAPWDEKHVNFNLYTDPKLGHVCRCGSTNIRKKGFAYTQVSKFQKYRCGDCGAETRGRVNLIEPDERKLLHLNITN